jgi:hypothetical protein
MMNFKDSVYKSYEINDINKIAVRFELVTKEKMIFYRNRLGFYVFNHLAFSKMLKEKFNVESVTMFSLAKKKGEKAIRNFRFHVHLNIDDEFYKIEKEFYTEMNHFESWSYHCDEKFEPIALAEDTPEGEKIREIEYKLDKEIKNFFNDYPSIRLDIITGNFTTNR